LLANLALAVALFISLGRDTAAPQPSAASETNVISSHVAGPARTNVVVRRQLFTWAEVESSDYSTYIANLRRIGCPEATIRDIIVADVNDAYARKIATEVVTTDQQWWRSNPDPEIQRAAIEKLRRLDGERRELLNSLLGAGWDRGPLDALVANPSSPAPQAVISLTGPVLGVLPAETKQMVQSINLQATQRLNDYLARVAAAGEQPDPAELARLRQQTRNELARLLTPIQLEEYLLRYSENGMRLREQFRGLDLEPDEFRNVFRAVDLIDQQLQLLGGTNDLAGVRRRAQLEQQRERALEQALGEERYRAYQITRDPAFVQAKAAAQSAGATAEAAFGLYQINKAVEEERRRINADRTLTTAERIERLQHVVTEQEKSLLALFGEEAYARYRQGTNPPLSR
jgi:hypothetical protein